MLALCSDNVAVIGKLITSNKLNAIEQGSCDWASGKLVNHKTQGELTHTWRLMSGVVNGVKNTMPDAYVGITKAFKNAKEEIKNV